MHRASRFTRFAFLVMIVAGVSACVPRAQTAYDIVIRQGRVLDGTGRERFAADIGIVGDRVVAVGSLSEASAPLVIDANGLIVAPGFIDIHAHVLGAMEGGNPVEAFLRDGVTTVIDGNDGVSAWPVRDALARLAQAPLSMNVGTFVGLNPVRKGVMGASPGAATEDELMRMRQLVEQALSEGAFGLTSGLEPALYHWPGYFTSADDLVRLLEPVSRLDGLYAPHIRDEAQDLFAAVEETIDVASRAKVRTDITHAKAVGPGNRGRAEEMVETVKTARERGVDVAFDQFPYGENGIDLTQLLPPWSFERGQDLLLEHLRKPRDRQAIAAFVKGKIREHAGTSDALYFRRCRKDPSVAGRTLADVSRGSGVEGNLLAEAEGYLRRIEHDDCVIDEAAIDEVDVVAILKSPLTAVASDGGIGAHPKSYGTRARVLGRYVRDQKVLTLEEAVRRMTSLPAERLRLPDRGILRPGAFADIVIFDAGRVSDRATRERPTEYSAGIRHLLVNGKAVILNDALTEARPGRVVRGPAAVLNGPGSPVTRSAR